MTAALAIGDAVFHRQYARGVVRAVDGLSVHVEFDVCGPKKVLASFLGREAGGLVPSETSPLPASLRMQGGSRRVTTVSADTLHGLPVPPRLWHVPGTVPGQNVTILYGDGGTGKSLLALQLAASTALPGVKWIGMQPAHGRVLYLSAEDDIDELHRRLADIVASHGFGLSDLSGLKIVPLAGEDAVLAASSGRSNVIATTPLWRQIEAEVEAFKPALVVLDTLADLFAGEENSRTQARQFIGLLRGLALKRVTTVLMLAHPSLNGMASGSGSSGSTGWSNSVRSRLYLERKLVAVDAAGKGELSEADPDLRVLTTKKANYGRTGGEIRIRWTDGVFQPEQGGDAAGAFDQVQRIMQADWAFLQLLAEHTAQGRHVSATPSANYAPTVFSRDPMANGLTRHVLTVAMNRLFQAGRITVGDYGPPSKLRKCIVLAETADD